jgi:hypothetical protein
VLHGRQHDQTPPPWSGHATTDKEQVALGVDAHDLEILLTTIDGTEMTRHPLTLPDATRALVLTNGSRRAM